MGKMLLNSILLSQSEYGFTQKISLILRLTMTSNELYSYIQHFFLFFSGHTIIHKQIPNQFPLSATPSQILILKMPHKL